MFYISKITPFFFLLAFTDLFIAVFSGALGYDYVFVGILSVFGFILHTVIGAAYQIIPNSQQSQLKGEKLQIFVFVSSALASFFMFLKNYPIASLFTLTATFLFTAHVLPVIKNYQPITIKFLILSLLYMNLGALFFAMAYIPLSFIPFVPFQLAVHTMTLGMMLNAIIGVQTAWIPMILMHTLNQKVANAVLIVIQIGVIVVLAGFGILNYKIVAAGSVILLTGVLIFLWIVYDCIKNTTHKELPYTVKFFVVGLVFLILGILSGAHLSGSKNFDMVPFHMTLMVFGFGGITIAGGMFHLLPRIVWNMVHVKKAQEGKNIPNVFNVLKKKEALLSLYVMVAGVVLMAGATFVELNTTRYLSSLVYLTGLLLFFRALFYRLFLLYTL
ncbi:hypothetical protein GWK41_03335 [Persephonella atlantica]|uniref:Uncharacterized protein n=1 Tax=Persephonella atlantica TaxID=2699429 RepID=A0ABS1GGP1_9AQUI|nr:hypothetical protein [Persephonella atlantica]MBK3332099.1 hypothetical protein [Persephonella atlantica]